MKDGKRQNNDFDFEIRFYEGILRRKSDFVQALIALGELYTRKGDHEKGLAVDLRLSVLRPDDPMVLYNLACSHSLLNHVDEAFRIMKKAIRCGYDDFQYLREDRDLANLFQNGRFRRLISRLQERKIRRVEKKRSDAGKR